MLLQKIFRNAPATTLNVNTYRN